MWLLLFNCSVVSDSLQTPGLQPARWWWRRGKPGVLKISINGEAQAVLQNQRRDKNSSEQAEAERVHCLSDSSQISISWGSVIGASLVSFGCIIVYLCCVILDSLHWNLHIWVIRFLFQIYRFALAETVFHQSAQLHFLGVSEGDVLGQMEPAISVSLELRQWFEFWGWGRGRASAWRHLDPTAGLSSSLAEAVEWVLQLPGFSGQIY